MNEKNVRKEMLLKQIASIKKNSKPELVSKLKLELVEKIVNRLFTLSTHCKECEDYISTLEKEVLSIVEGISHPVDDSYKEYHANLQIITNHLNKEHNLVEEGYYTSLYMSLGIAIGLPLGLVFSQVKGNIGLFTLGLPLGLGIGLLIGTNLDAKAKEEGNTI